MKKFLVMLLVVLIIGLAGFYGLFVFGQEVDFEKLTEKNQVQIVAKSSPFLTKGEWAKVDLYIKPVRISDHPEIASVAFRLRYNDPEIQIQGEFEPGPTFQLENESWDVLVNKLQEEDNLQAIDFSAIYNDTKGYRLGSDLWVGSFWVRVTNSYGKQKAELVFDSPKTAVYSKGTKPMNLLNTPNAIELEVR